MFNTLMSIHVTDSANKGSLKFADVLLFILFVDVLPKIIVN